MVKYVDIIKNNKMKVKIQITNTYYKSVDLEIDINHQRYEEHKLKYPNLSMEDYLLENEGEYTHDIDDMMSEASLEWADSEWKYETEDEEGSLEEPLTSDFDKKTNKMRKEEIIVKLHFIEYESEERVLIDEEGMRMEFENRLKELIKTYE